MKIERVFIVLALLCILVVPAVTAYDQWSNTSVMLHLNGTQNSTTINDEIGNTWSKYGDFQINTSASKFGGASGFWKKGKSSYISVPGSVLFEYDKKDVTIDFWINAPTGAAQYSRLYSIQTPAFSLELIGDQVYFYTITHEHIILNTADVADETWHHIAFSANGTYVKAAVDGVWGTPLAYTDSLGSPSSTIYIGRYFSGTYPEQDYNGMLDEYRISKWDVFGLNTFTPPTSEYFPPVIAPIANFTASPTDMMYGATLQLNDTSTNSPTMWNYSFLDGAGTKTWSNGTTLAFQNLTQIMSTGGNFTIQLYAQNAGGGNYSAKQQYLDVWNWSPASFTAAPVMGANPLTVIFAGSSNNATTYYWEFGDTITDTVQNPTHIYTSVGTFSVNYGTKNSHHEYNWSNQSGYVTVNATLVADFSGAPLSGYMNPDFPVNFVDMSTGEGLYYWYWEFGDTGTSLLRNPSHTYTAPGSYPINLTVKGLDGETNLTRNNYINISPMGASFTSNTTFGTPPLAVQFTDTSDGYPASWCWTFGDGGWSNDQNPVYTYLTDGVWDVYLHTNTTYESNWSNMTGYINTITPPTEVLTANQTIGVSPLAIQFNVTSSGGIPTMWNYSYIAPDGVTEVWFFNTSDITERNATYTFTGVGIYNVTLTATNGGGYSTSGFDIEVGGAVIVDWASYVITGLCPLRMQFLDKSTNSSAWNWDFGDGDYSELQNPTHWYNDSGIYTVTFNASSMFDYNISIKSDYVNTTICAAPSGDPPVCDFSGIPLLGNAPMNVQFTDASANAPNQWFWTFGEGSASGWQNPNNTYWIAGNYTVTLICANEFGYNSEEKVGYIGVDSEITPTPSPTPLPPAAPTAKFDANTTTGNYPLAVQFFDMSFWNITSWTWNFGDGYTSNGQNPLHFYNNTGQYNVSLAVANELGSNTTVKVNYITIYPPSDTGVNFAGSPRYGAYPLLVGFTDLSNIPGRNVTAWNWSFGDGNYSSAQNPLNTYWATGYYSIHLSVNATNLDNVTILSATKINYIHVTANTSVVGTISKIPMLPAQPQKAMPVRWINENLLWVVIVLLIVVAWLVLRRR